MPTRTKLVTVEEAPQSLTGLTHSNLFKLASKTAQAKASLVLRWLVRAMDNAAPDFGESGNEPDMRRVIERMEFLCSHEEAVGVGGAPRCFGPVALAKIYEVAKRTQ